MKTVKQKAQNAAYMRRRRVTRPNDVKYMKAYAAKHKARLTAYRRAYNKSHRAQRNANEMKRRARLLNQTCECCTAADFHLVYKAARLLGQTVDHVKPLAKGGMHCVLNMQFLTRVENSRKRARWP